MTIPCRHGHMPCFTVASAAAMLLLVACSHDTTSPSAGTAPRTSFAYTYAPGSTTLEVLPGLTANTNAFEPHAINDAGIVVGHEALTTDQLTPHAVRWAADGQMTYLSTDGADATGINTSGVISGYVYEPGTQIAHAAKWVNGVMSRLAEPAANVQGGVVESQAMGINDAGQIVGTVWGPFDALTTNGASISDSRRAVVWETDGSLSFLPLPDESGMRESWGYAINASGEVGGVFYGPGTNGQQTAIRWSSGHQPTSLPDLGAGAQGVTGINSSGTMIGTVVKPTGGFAAVQWQGTTMTELPADFSFVSGGGIADDGAIAGTSVVNGGNSDRAVIWQSGQEIDMGGPPGGIGFNRGMGLNQVGGVITLCFVYDPSHGQYLAACRGRPSTAGSGNHAPEAALANASGNEGASITLDASGSTDADGDVLTYTFNFGDGSASVTGTAAQVSHTYSDNGSYSASVTVSDPSATQAQAGATVTVTNVAPTIGTPQLAGLSTKVPTTLAAQVIDPGTNDGPWNYTIAWGDGRRATTGTVSGGRISEGYQYHSAGSYTISVSVRDKDGGTATRSVAAVVTQVKKK